MAKRVEDTDGLTPEEAKACLYRAQGLSQSDAYRRAFNKPQAKPKTINEKACRLFAKPATQARTDDDTLLEQLADGDPAKLAALRTVLGAKDTFDA